MKLYKEIEGETMVVDGDERINKYANDIAELAATISRCRHELVNFGVTRLTARCDSASAVLVEA